MYKPAFERSIIGKDSRIRSIIETAYATEINNSDQSVTGIYYTIEKITHWNNETKLFDFSTIHKWKIKFRTQEDAQLFHEALLQRMSNYQYILDSEQQGIKVSSLSDNEIILHKFPGINEACEMLFESGQCNEILTQYVETTNLNLRIRALL